jgi:hypothetical protein
MFCRRVSGPARIVIVGVGWLPPPSLFGVLVVLPRGRYRAPFNFNSLMNSQMKAMSSIK